MVTPWDGFPSTEEILKRYADQTDRDMSAFDWYYVVACFKFGIILEGTFARACAGIAPKEIGERLHAGGLRLLNRADHIVRRNI